VALRFDRFVLDTGARRLLRDGRDVHLSPKAFTLLELLVARRPDAVSKTEIHDALWPATNVVEANIANLVGEIRGALEDDRRQPRCIRTVPRFGYAFAFDDVSDDRGGGSRISGADSRSDAPSIAVLPFANTSHKTEQEYFADGLAGEIISALTQIPGIKVTARTSAFAFKGRNDDVRKIAEVLGVAYVLEGTVQRVDARLRVTAHLVRAADGTQLWSQRYDRDLSDVFAVQDEIATAIAVALSVTLPRAEDISRRHEPSLPAYEAYLKGRHHIPSRPTSVAEGREATTRGITFLKQAISLDPDWAEPHNALGQLYFFLAHMGAGALDEMISLVRAEAQRASAIDRADPNSKALLAAVAASYDYDWNEANGLFRSAFVSESLPPAVHDLFAVFYLSPLGQFDAAIAQNANAIARDPLHLLWRVRHLTILICAGMYERAIRDALNILEFENHSFLARFAIAQAHFFQGALREARIAAEDAYRLAPWSPSAAGFLAGVLTHTGESDRAGALIDAIPPTAPAGRIYFHAVQSDTDGALDWYERAVERRHPIATELASAHFLKELRASPRWPTVARALNLPAAGAGTRHDTAQPVRGS
jgi:TolB-like protein